MELLVSNINSGVELQKELMKETDDSSNTAQLKTELLEMKAAIETLNAGDMNKIAKRLQSLPLDDNQMSAVRNIAKKILIAEYSEAATLIDELLPLTPNP